MKKIRLFPLAMLVLLSLAMQGARMQPPEPERLLVNTYQKLQITPVGYVLHQGSRIERRMPSGQLDDWVYGLARKLGLGRANKFIEQDGVKYIASGKQQGNTLLKLVVIHDHLGDNQIAPYVSLQVMGRGAPGESFYFSKMRMTRVLQSYGIIPDYHFSLKGRKWANAKNVRQPVVEMLRLLGAKEVEAMQAERTVSISANSPLLPQGILTGGGMMNVQVAARMSSDAKSWLLTIGTPIITVEY